MVRPRSFDEPETRFLLLSQFWATGFEGTSLPDLEKATGLSRKSLYNAFGDKRAMFLHALRQFRRTAVERNTAPLEGDGNAAEAIEAVLSGLVRMVRSGRGRDGCLVCNTSREAIRHDPDICAEIDAYFSQLRHKFTATIERGQERGEIGGRSAADLAALCVSAVVSISVLSKAGQPVDMLDAISRETIAALR